MRKVVLAFTVLIPSWLHAQPAVCTYSAASQDIVFDMRTGRITSAATYHESSSVTLFVVNKNPYLYDYSVKVDEQPQGEPALAGFLKDLVPFAADFAPAKDATAEKSLAPDAVAKALTNPQLPSLCIQQEAALENELVRYATDFSTY